VLAGALRGAEDAWGAASVDAERAWGGDEREGAGRERPPDERCVPY
jgi:hypothetical protein